LAKAEIETQGELRETVGLIAEDMLAERELKNALDTELQAVREKYTADLADLESQIEQRTELCAEYCTRHPDLFGKDVKSIDLGQAVIGFRTGTPKVKVLKRWTVEAVMTALKARKWFQYIRTSEALDKERIIAERDQIEPVLDKIGLAVVQEESFYIEPKLATVSKSVGVAA
jgi:phage host-nuclease inhibitor protein Gam